jgi:hypothetical protein
MNKPPLAVSKVKLEDDLQTTNEREDEVNATATQRGLTTKTQN